MSKRTAHGNESGVYAAPADTSALRAACRGPQDSWRLLDLSTARNKADVLRALAHAFEFREDFGHNWDALADALQDLSWLRWSRLVLEITGAEALKGRAPEGWAVALDILRGAATYWASHRKILLVLVHGASDLPALCA